MRLPGEAATRLLILGLSTALAGCALVGGDGKVTSPSQARAMLQPSGTGPAADYPMVLGDPFTVEGELFTPADTLNYDAVGFTTVDPGEGISAAHRTLPLPSYAEVTSLESGKTILVRVERRGPMTGNSLLALSAAAADDLGAADGSPVRIRRVNPPEVERAELRAGRAAADRMETPQSLVQILRRKLPARGVASVGAVPVEHQGTSPAAVPPTSPVLVAAPEASTPAVAVLPERTSAGSIKASGGFVIQAAAFSVRANADRAAQALSGVVSPSGKLFRVRTGPFTTRAQAEAALAKVRAAGYSDARVTTAG